MWCGYWVAAFVVLTGCGDSESEPVGMGGSGGSTGGAVPMAAGGSSAPTGGTNQLPEPADGDVAVIDSLLAVGDDTGAVAVEFEGRAGLRDLLRVTAELLDASGNVLGEHSGWGSWLERPDRFSGIGSAGHFEPNGARFSGFMSFRDTNISGRAERVRVTLEDIEQMAGEPVEATITQPSPETREVGQLCDPFELLNRCDASALCDVIDGAGRVAPTCQIPDDVCPKEMLELRDTLQASNEASPDDTYASCTFSRGNLGNDQGHVFVASKSGSHRFSAENIDDLEEHVAATLYARRICNFGREPESELGCAHMKDFAMNEPVELVLELEAGQTVFVYVEATWIGGGEYVLSVEEPG